jgi:hypothetical protein
VQCQRASLCRQGDGECCCDDEPRTSNAASTMRGREWLHRSEGERRREGQRASQVNDKGASRAPRSCVI